MDKNKKNVFETKIAPILEYIGTIGAVICIIAYIVCVIVLINGFEKQTAVQTLIFALVNAVIGFLIMQCLKIQGISFAQNLEENKPIIEQYYKSKTKDKKPHGLTYFWIKTTVVDVAVKCFMVCFCTMGVMYIVIQASNDWNLLTLAFVNLLMFICFGLLALNKAYNFYNNSNIPFMIEKIKEAGHEPVKIEELKDDKNQQQSL